jgi:SAM-dependent methyltransferase
MSPDDKFDAIVGRYVLQFMPDPTKALQRIARHLLPGGIIIFHELGWDGTRSSPVSPTYDRVCGWLSRTIEAAGEKCGLAQDSRPCSRMRVRRHRLYGWIRSSGRGLDRSMLSDLLLISSRRDCLYGETRRRCRV